MPITVVMFFLSGGWGGCRCGSGRGCFMGSGPLVCAGATAVAALALARDSTTGPTLLPPLLLFAVGLSLIVAPLTATVLADAGPSDAGIASGVNNAVARVAGAARDRGRRRGDRRRLRIGSTCQGSGSRWRSPPGSSRVGGTSIGLGIGSGATEGDLAAPAEAR